MGVGAFRGDGVCDDLLKHRLAQLLQVRGCLLDRECKHNVGGDCGDGGKALRIDDARGYTHVDALKIVRLQHGEGLSEASSHVRRGENASLPGRGRPAVARTCDPPPEIAPQTAPETAPVLAPEFALRSPRDRSETIGIAAEARPEAAAVTREGEDEGHVELHELELNTPRQVWRRCRWGRRRRVRRQRRERRRGRRQGWRRWRRGGRRLQRRW